MNQWQEFLRAKEACAEVWKRLKRSFEGKEGEFLKKSYLVISYGPKNKQMPFDVSSAMSIAKEHPGFFVRDPAGELFIVLADRIKQAEKDNRKLQKRDLERFENFDPDRLKVVHFQFEARFPTVKIEVIQKIKESQYCDKERAVMSRAAINVVLKVGL